MTSDIRINIYCLVYEEIALPSAEPGGMLP